MTIPLISTTQTDANSPINETLMEGLRQRSTYTPLGAIIPWYDFNGLIAVPEGFMVCNGQVINSTNYNTEHGAGAWTTEIGTCQLDGKYTPNIADDAYLTGTSTTQAGSSAITSVGSNTVDISHNHQWYNANASNASDETYNSSGSAIGLPNGSKDNGYFINVSDGTTIPDTLKLPDCYTTVNASTTQAIRPKSYGCKFIIRII